MSDADEAKETENASATRAVRVLTILALLAGFGAGGAMGVMVVGPHAATRLVPEAEVTGAAAPEEDGHGYGDEAANGRAGNEPLVHVIEDLVVNPSESGGTRFLLTSIALELSDTVTPEEVDAREVELRDGLIRILGSRTVSELSDMDRRSELIDEIRRVLTGVLGERAVDRVFLPQFVIQ